MDKKDTLNTDSKDPSYNKELQKLISEEYDQQDDEKNNVDSIDDEHPKETKSEKLSNHNMENGNDMNDGNKIKLRAQSKIECD